MLTVIILTYKHSKMFLKKPSNISVVQSLKKNENTGAKDKLQGKLYNFHLKSSKIFSEEILLPYRNRTQSYSTISVS